MSIFDNMDPGQISGMFDIGASPYGTQSQPGGYFPGIEEDYFGNREPQIPQPPGGSGRSDVSGFANFGMTPPPLPPMQPMPNIPDFSEPSQAMAPQQFQGFQGIPDMPRPGLADTPNPIQPNQNPDPMQQIAGLMAMMGDPHKYAREKSAPQQGGLMAYLNQLGVV